MSAWRLVEDPPPPVGGGASGGERGGEPRRPRPSTRRLLVVAATVLLTLVGAGGLAAARTGSFFAERPEGCAKPDRSMQLYAVELPKDGNQVRLGYGLTPQTASYPGPTIEMTEGECLAITVHNQVPAATLEQLRTDPAHPLGVSLHVHGVKYTQLSDGTVQSGSFVPPGESRTYTWFAQQRNKKTGAPGTAGHWWYHDHVVGGPHGTQGLGAGLFGGLVVRRPGDPKPDRTYTVVFGDRQSINLRRGAAADTCDAQQPQPGPTCLVARKGEKVEFIVVGIGNDMHTFHLHGHAWADNRTGVLPNGEPFADLVPTIDNKPLGPGDSFGVTVTAGDSVGPGHWMLHCHMQFHSDGGMSTMLHVLDENGNMPPGHDHSHAHPAGGTAAGTTTGADTAAGQHQHK
ncbi:multicopper oxidase domain-containing protein [Micromonospora sp. C28SCA-DRY-2]|uniref:multicopper oxidase domain-containing protein n=1 Tax=Micromonospora sp. C28SCA-DRY-2 TaxID=3059522 RepID=UPI0026767319|nr:multicopper oxidase domain-containing protein [Micromonospora sp. C28SCA-DRY-2]MDO3704499.1 multicopper oxidase domain-containing protein [Micromonospora sp. C28SCA-DRY-2]